jgi:pre-mRNA-splicing factor SYF1
MLIPLLCIMRAQAAKVYAEAVKTVEPKEATGKPHSLWVAYAKLYERHGDLNTARMIFKKATQIEFRTVDDLASVWCEWAEMELRQKHYDEALKTLQQACTIPRIVRVNRVRSTPACPSPNLALLSHV